MTVNGNTSISSTNELTQPEVQNRRALLSAKLGEDRTKLSADRDKFEQLRAAVANQPEVRQDRVAAVRQSIANRTQPSNDQIANALVKEYSGESS